MQSFVEARLPGALTPFVGSMAGYRIDGASPGTHIGMPSGTVTLVLALDEPLHLVGADGRRGRFDTLIAGMHASPAHILHDGCQHGIQLDLTPHGASLLLGGPPGEISGTSVDLGELVGPSARRLHERLSETPDWSRRFDLVVEALFARREARWLPRPEVDHAWQLLARSRGRAPVREVAREVGWSPRHLGERFRQEFGQAPKTTARVLRFQESHRLIAAGRPLAEAAARAGYADQSHLNRDWLAFAGTSPTRWRREDEIAFVQDEVATGARS
ncbi:helix-turn-helix domain-containing protein [Janibacter cremeus]|uniref:AraC-like DNA-binding protein n=1 Tax=Janibacter cremeus TaxID=1285192 RepID=A0A852VYX3_9MICO|nr:AraC-like DNA-binding protein [Janibacter cremeus]